MGIVKRIICLANSRKRGGTCVAGVDIGAPPSWIRPVSNRPGQAVSFDERKYEDETDPRLLDVIEVPLLHACPAGHQRENWLLDPQAWWVKVDEVGWDDLDAVADGVGPLWINGSSSSLGLNNRVPSSQIAEVTDSLRLIHVPRLRLTVGTAWNRKRVEGYFDFDGTSYEFRVTDPEVEEAYLGRAEGVYRLGECYLTVSLGEQFDDGYYYKFIAGVTQRGA